MKFEVVVSLLFFSVAALGQLHQPITHVEACRIFSDAIVQVTTDQMSGTGFIVSSDGWIITALHVVADPDTLTPYDNPRIAIKGQRNQIPAEIASPIDKLASIRDVVILKIDKTQLPELELGSESEVESGEELSVIGLPLSAIFRMSSLPIPKFCMRGTVAAQTAFPQLRR